MAALETALILGGIKGVGGLLSAGSRREAAKRKAELARKQLEQDRLFKRLQLRHGWGLHSQQAGALNKAPKLALGGPSKTGTFMDMLGQLGSAAASTYETYTDLKDKEEMRDLYKKLLKQRQGGGTPKTHTFTMSELDDFYNAPSYEYGGPTSSDNRYRGVS